MTRMGMILLTVILLLVLYLPAIQTSDFGPTVSATPGEPNEPTPAEPEPTSAEPSEPTSAPPNEPTSAPPNEPTSAPP